jgi:excisionase family DNA binding protein
MENLLTVGDVANILKMSKSTVYKLAENGDINSKKIGSCRRFSNEQVTAFISLCNENINTAKLSKKNKITE